MDEIQETIYTFVPDRKQFDRPIWELPQDPDGQNLKYYSGGWIIHGDGNDVLSFRTDSHFPPIEDLNVEWTHSGDIDGLYHVWIKCIDSYSPTNTPTVSPTISLETISIIYVLTNLTTNNYDFILSDDENKLV